MVKKETLSVDVTSQRKKPWTRPVLHDLPLKETFGSNVPNPTLEGDDYIVAAS